MRISAKFLVKTLISKLRRETTIMIHGIGSEGRYDLSSQTFTSFLKDFGDYCARKKGKRILITFDDGYESVFFKAFPLLKEQHIPFVCFLVTDFINRPGYLQTGQIQEMLSSGLCKIGDHGKTHQILPSLDSQQRLVEIADSKKSLETDFHVKISDFAFSHGQYEITDLNNLKSLGFSRAYLAQDRYCYARHGILKPRLNLCEATSENVFTFLKQSGYHYGKKSI